jgi:hypothetical protein
MDENEKDWLPPELSRLLSPEYEREREEKQRLAKEQRERMERNLEEAKRLREALKR